MRPLKIFLVEDSPLVRENLSATLEELAPVLVVGSADGEDAAARWLGTPGNHADLVIVDIFLSRGSGPGVLSATRARAPQQTMVVLSNYVTAEVRRRCLELGAARVFDKSNEIEALILYCTELAEAIDVGQGAA